MAAVLWTLTVLVGVVALVRPGRDGESSQDWRLWSLFAVLLLVSVLASSGVTHLGDPEPYDVAEEIAQEVDGTYDGVFSTPSLQTLEKQVQEKTDGDVRITEHGWDGDDHRFELTGTDGTEPACLTVTVPHALGRATDPIDVRTSVARGTC